MCTYCYIYTYRIAGNFRGVQFSRMIDLYNFVSLIFTDAPTHAYYALYNRAYYITIYFQTIIFLI